MDIKIQIVVACVLLITLTVIVNMIRRKRLELRYALVWLGVGVCILILDWFPILTTWVAHKVGIANPINMLFFCGFCFSLAIIFVLTIAISRMSIRMRQIAQKMALLERENK